MSFKDLGDIPQIIDSSNHNISKDFLCPVLKEAKTFDRGVGYFTSGWLSSVSLGIIPLVERGGKIRLITSPYLNKKDYEAMLMGDEARKDEIIYQALSRGIEQLRADLNTDARIALSWLVADQILDIRIAIPHNKLEGGDFHVKFGILKDEEDSKILFVGSYNDTAHANINYEELAIFTSFDGNSNNIIEQKEMLFERIWKNEDPNIQTMEVPDAVIQEMKSFKGKVQRPYKFENAPKQISDKPYSIEGYEPWKYQSKAIDKWFQNDMRGIFEMATGTGKTKTSFFALTKLSEKEDRLVTIIACPSKSLVSQWQKECSEFNLKPIVCSSDNYKWKKELSDEVSKINLNLRKYLTIVSTHETLKSNEFKVLLERIERNDLKILLIADECHHLGSEGAIENIYRDFDYTLGLSATPERFYDEEGSRFIESLLGPIIYTYTLNEAIQAGFLCPYEYYVHEIFLTEEEMEEYQNISNRIRQLVAAGNSDDIKVLLKGNQRLSGLLNLRAKILKTAEMKVPKLQELVMERKNEIRYAIVFCAPDTDELDNVAKMFKDINIVSHRFTGEESTKERDEILKNFEKETYQFLTSMNIFNEGIDVPFAREAFILSSSTNPTEYVQRRGRVLRKPSRSDKEKAIIHDFIVLPIINGYNTVSDLEKQIVIKEINRAFLFAEDAMNGLSIMEQLNQILDQYIKINS